MKRAIALGAFDGLHAAHMAVLKAAARLEDTFRPAVLLFDQHPLQTLAGQAPPRLLTDEDRDTQMKQLGLELLYTPFRTLRDLSPQAFFEDILLERFGAGALCCGYDYHFGAGGAGNAALLQELCAANSVQLHVIAEIPYKGAPVSSTRIRQALEQGSIADANAMLGRPFGYAFPVVHGSKIGRTLDAPTINQIFPPGFAVPRNGVYASQTYAEDRWQASVTNIGVRPCFGGDELRSETFITGFSGDLYGKRVPVRLLRYLRPEKKFDSIAQLKEQIAIDAQNAQKEG